MSSSQPTIWPEPDGTPIACREKLKALTRNYMELLQSMQDTFEDAVLMGVDPAAMRWMMIDMVTGLQDPKQL